MYALSDFQVINLANSNCHAMSNSAQKRGFSLKNEGPQLHAVRNGTKSMLFRTQSNIHRIGIHPDNPGHTEPAVGYGIGNGCERRIVALQCILACLGIMVGPL